MGRKILDIKISEYNEVDRKAYFRNHYHNKINVADLNSVKRVQSKPELLKLLIIKIGIGELLKIHMNDIKIPVLLRNEDDDKVEVKVCN